MSEEQSNAEWQKLWQDYNNSLERWRQIFENFQKATLEMQTKYNEVMEKAAAESSKDTMKDFGENWQKAMNDAGLNVFKQFNDNWQKAMNDYGASAFKQFSDSWQKYMNDASLESMKAYGEMMKTFAETWNKMWPNK